MGKFKECNTSEKSNGGAASPIVEEIELLYPLTGKFEASEECSLCDRRENCPIWHQTQLRKRDVERKASSARRGSDARQDKRPGKKDTPVKSRRRMVLSDPPAKSTRRKRKVCDPLSGDREEFETILSSDAAPGQKIYAVSALLYKRSHFPIFLVLNCVYLLLYKNISADRIVELLSKSDLRSLLGGDDSRDRTIPAARTIYDWAARWRSCMGDQARLLQEFLSPDLQALMDYCPEGTCEQTSEPRHTDGEKDTPLNPKQLLEKICSRLRCFLPVVTLIVSVYADGSLSMRVRPSYDRTRPIQPAF